MSVHRVPIFDNVAGKPVFAELDDDLPSDVLLDIEDAWNPFRRTIARRLKELRISRNNWPESLHWNWARKSLSATLSYSPTDIRIFAVRFARQWQAAMLILLTAAPAALSPDVGQPLVYVDYIETAPWNWSIERLGQKSRFSKLGKLMMLAAVELSLAEDRSGRVGLHSLSQAERFYKACGLRFVRFDAAKQNLPYYEFTAQAANAFLRRPLI